VEIWQVENLSVFKKTCLKAARNRHLQDARELTLRSQRPALKVIMGETDMLQEELR
jgi:hypothetical protein